MVKAGSIGTDGSAACSAIWGLPARVCKLTPALHLLPFTLAVCAEMIERLGAQGAPLAGGLLERIGELCAGGDEAAAAAGGAVDDAVLLVAQNALGQAMQVRRGV